jgi:hypothetical protein
MDEPSFILSRDQRDDISKAVTAIERRVREMAAKPTHPDIHVIWTNLTIIRTNLSNLAQLDSWSR